MFCIDLSKSDDVGTEPVASWDLEIGGKPYEYGAPSYFDAGKLYLWLPFSAVGKEITVKLKRYNEDGSLKPVEDLSATPGDSSGSGLGKRWISYELTDEFKTENASLFSKYYDGESIKNLIASLESYVGTDGLPAPYEANKDAKLTNPDALLYQSAKLGDDGKPLDEYYPTEAVHDHKVLPTDSGSISMRVQSKEFAQPGTSTAESFWGHDTSFTVNIFPVNSKTEFTSYTLKSDGGSTLAQLDGPTWMQDDDANPNKASVNHLIVPVDVTSFTYPDGDTVDGSNMTKPTCAAPFGQVQLFLDDRPISAAHGGVMTFTREDLEDEDNDAVAIVKDRDGREHTVLLFDISRSQLEAHGLKSTENDEHTVAAVYTSRTDAKPATAPAPAPARRPRRPPPPPRSTATTTTPRPRGPSSKFSAATAGSTCTTRRAPPTTPPTGRAPPSSVTNTRPGTCWYDAVVRAHIPAGLSYVAGSAVVTDAQSACHRDFPADFEDGTGDVAFSVGDVPGGLVPVSGGIKLVLPDGSETTCPDDAYSPEKGDVVVFAGPVRGGQKVRLVIDAVVTEDALGTDIGNVAFAYGTDPSGTETTVLTSDPSGTPGWRFEGIDGLEQTASEGTAFRSESKVTYPEGYDGQVRPNPAGDGDTKLKMRRLAKTGDEVPLALPLGLAMLAASALAVIALAARTNRRARG